jgi:unsaturated rhamnogalacturonyl hydrolase
VRVLEYLPMDHPRRGDFVDLLKTMAAALVPLQSTDGTWHSDLLKPDAFPNPETSGTAFFTYGMAWGIHHGILDRAKYLPVVTKAWNALAGYVTAEGRLQWVQLVGKEPGKANAGDHQSYGGGALLLAASEIIEL